MLRSPTFLFFYLPWLAGIVLMFVVLAPPIDTTSSDNSVYQSTIYPLDGTPESVAELVSLAPRFPRCVGRYYDNSCTRQSMEKYVYRNVGFPANSENTGTAGLVVASFYVNRDGSTERVSLMRDPGYGRGADALRVVRKMLVDHETWIPASVNGKPERQRVYVKIRYSNFQWAN